MEFFERETKECEQRTTLLTAMFQEHKSETKLYKLNRSGEKVPLYRVQCVVNNSNGKKGICSFELPGDCF